LPGLVLSFTDKIGIDLDTDTPGAESLCRSDDNGAVAAAKVIHHISGFDPGHLEHAIGNFNGSWHEGHFAVGPHSDRGTAAEKREYENELQPAENGFHKCVQKS
jgi:hypothetical protein